MTEGMSLRERKKLQTRHRLLAAATELFAERGFDKVSVAEIAEAAEVSKMTVFNYFSGKEDLVLAPMEEHVGDVARTVRDRAPGESALAAVRGQFVAAVERRDPSVGMSDLPVVLGVRRLIQETPALLTRAHGFSMRSFDLLAEVLVEEGRSRHRAGRGRPADRHPQRPHPREPAAAAGGGVGGRDRGGRRGTRRARFRPARRWPGRLRDPALRPSARSGGHGGRPQGSPDTP